MRPTAEEERDAAIRDALKKKSIAVDESAEVATLPIVASKKKKRAAIVRRAGAGREYDLGEGVAIVKADGDETRGKYSISEWWLEPYTRGPTKHQHPEDDVFFMLEGTMRFFVGGKWIDAKKGMLVIAPGNTPHAFENRTSKRAGFLNVSVPGDFEPHLEGIAEWFRTRSLVRTTNAPEKKAKRR